MDTAGGVFSEQGSPRAALLCEQQNCTAHGLSNNFLGPARAALLGPCQSAGVWSVRSPALPAPTESIRWGPELGVELALQVMLMPSAGWGPWHGGEELSFGGQTWVDLNSCPLVYVTTPYSTESVADSNTRVQSLRVISNGCCHCHSTLPH
jgi:hypothetical protein